MNSATTEINPEHQALLTALEARRTANKGIERIDNGSLRAGSPMYFYCNGCGATITVPESYTSRPYDCPPCIELRKLSLL